MQFQLNLKRYTHTFTTHNADTTIWLTVTEVTQFAGWSRQRTHALLNAGIIETRTIRIGQRNIRKVSSRDVLSILKSRRI